MSNKLTKFVQKLFKRRTTRPDTGEDSYITDWAEEIAEGEATAREQEVERRRERDADLYTWFQRSHMAMSSLGDESRRYDQAIIAGYSEDPQPFEVPLETLDRVGHERVVHGLPPLTADHRERLLRRLYETYSRNRVQSENSLSEEAVRRRYLAATQILPRYRVNPTPPPWSESAFIPISTLMTNPSMNLANEITLEVPREPAEVAMDEHEDGRAYYNAYVIDREAPTRVYTEERPAEDRRGSRIEMTDEGFSIFAEGSDGVRRPLMVFGHRPNTIDEEFEGLEKEGL